MHTSYTQQLSGWIKNRARFLHSKFMHRALTSFFILTITAGIFVLVSPAKAEILGDVANGLINGLSYIMIEIAGLFIQITIFALKFFIEIAGYNNYIEADVVQLGWNLVRDVANMFFVVVLLVIAFGTILGLEQYEWKKTLVKLVMAAFLVNFSNLICQVIIDAAQVFTVTFLNALAGAAGGNLIKMFNFDEIYTISTRGTDPTGIQIELFGGALMTLFFASIAMFTLGAYLVVMLARMAVLWTLMILSPLAFLFSALPNTQSYAQEFWSEFIHHVIVAPVMVFFLWLAFATFGGGNVVQENIERQHPLIIDGGIKAVTESTDANGNSLGASYSQATSWENMANFAVAIAFLWIGIDRVQKLGVTGGGLVSGALSFAKNVATIASGYAVGRWLVGGAKNLAFKGVGVAGKGLYDATLANRVEILKNWGSRQVEGWRDWRARGPKPKLTEAWQKGEAAHGTNEEGKFVDAHGNVVDSAYQKDARGNYFDAQGKRVDKEGSLLNEKGERIQQKNDDGTLRFDFARDAQGQVKFESADGGIDTRGTFQKFFFNRQQAILKSRKLLNKVKKEREVRDELIDKRVTAVPKYLMQKFEGPQVDAMDRVEQGMLEAEKARSAAKTEQYQAVGKQMTLSTHRFKNSKFETHKPTMEEQISAHKEEAARSSKLIEKGQEAVRKSYMQGKGAKVVEGRIALEEQLGALKAETKLVEDQTRTSVLQKDIEAAEKARARDEQIGIDLALGNITPKEAATEQAKLAGKMEDVLERKVAAEKQAHTESVKQERLQKGKEARYLEGGHGQEELREEALLKAETAGEEAIIKEEEARAKAETEASAGQAAVATRVAAEEAGKAAEEKAKATEVAMRAAFKEGQPGKEIEEERREAELAAKAAEAVVTKAEEQAKAKVEGTRQGKQQLTKMKEAELETEAAKKKQQELEEQATKWAATNLKQVFSQINLSEQAIKAAQDFVKNIKDKDLADKFKMASDQMLKLLGDRSKSLPELRRDLEKAKRDATYGNYVTAMHEAENLKRQTEISSLRTKQATDAAHDAFIHKPKYGTTSVSTVYSDYSESKMKDYRKLERLAGMKKATDTLVHLLAEQKRLKAAGKELDIDQTAELYGATAFLQEEAWNDDQAEYVFQMFKKLQKGPAGDGMNDAERDQWKNMATHFAQLGWLDKDVVEADGSIKQGVEVHGKYNRKNAAALQNLASTGGDVELVSAHNAISEAMGQNQLQVTAKKDEIREAEIKRLKGEDAARPLSQAEKDTREAEIQKEQIVAESFVRRNKQVKEQAKGYADEKVLEEKEKKQTAGETWTPANEKAFRQQQEEGYVDNFVGRAREEAEEISIERQVKAVVNTRIKAEVEPMEKDYWKLAEGVLDDLKIQGLENVQKLKERYEKHQDLLQDATRTFKKNSFDVGHEELGQNQDFDETVNMYRFQTKSEGQAKIRADRVKMKTRQLINTDQYHSNGTLDFDTGIIDDFLEDTISLTIGKVQKLIELSDIPERSLKGHAYIHKNEDAEVVAGKRGQLMGVIGGEAAMKKFATDGHTTMNQQTDHMLTRGVLAELMSGDRGWALSMAKLFKHVDEKDAQRGVVNLKIGNEEFKSTGGIAKHILDQMRKYEADGKDYLAEFGSSYKGQQYRVMKKLQDIMRRDGEHVGGGSSADDEQALGA